MASESIGQEHALSEAWHIAILIPARNEERLLASCLDSVALARAALPPELTSDVILVSDGSTDRTASIARSMLGDRGVVLEIASCNVGLARAFASETALGRWSGSLRRCWLANTDADCKVPANWLVEQMRFAQQGYVAIAGSIDVHDFSEHLPIVEQRFRQTYLIDADGSHAHVHGANFGMRADCYLGAGGWRALETAEDHDLWNRLHNVKRLQISNPGLRVLTSGRRAGRAPLGFANALAQHNLSIA